MAANRHIFGHFGSNLLHVTESDDGSVLAVHRWGAERQMAGVASSSRSETAKVMDGREYTYDLYAWDTGS